jgi:hypothetical protein
MEIELGNLQKVEIKNLWPSEPGDFTPWLAKNITKLSNVIGKDLEIIQTEYAVGDFSADIVANDLGTSRKVVIENQYGTSDHKHLGQVLLYCAGIKASCMIWIAEKFKDEHRQAFEWLNTNTINGIEFYAIELEVIQIDDSKPVPLFKIVESPNKNISINYNSSVTENTDTQEAYRFYFQSIIDELRDKHKFTNARVGQPQNWYSFASEQSKVYKYGTSFAMNDRVRTEIYIDMGDQNKNKEVFDKLFNDKDLIEKEFGNQLTWERLDDKRASRIAVYIDGSIADDTNAVENIKKWAIENLLKFKKVFPKYIVKAITPIA